MSFSTKDTIKDCCEKFGIEISDEVAQNFEVLSDMLLEFNSHTNVTALKTREDIAIKHFADSLAVLNYDIIKKNASVIDIGCGAGFPGLPIKMVRDDIKITFVDSTAKKLRFTSSVAKRFSLNNVEVCPERAEELVAKGKREKYDVAVSRAVASLPVLVELVLPYVKVGGFFVAYKSFAEADEKNKDSELSLAKNAIKKLGGKLEDVLDATIFDTSDNMQKHALIVIKKCSRTPVTFPRRYSAILKKTL